MENILILSFSWEEIKKFSLRLEKINWLFRLLIQEKLKIINFYGYICSNSWILSVTPISKGALEKQPSIPPSQPSQNTTQTTAYRGYPK